MQLGDEGTINHPPARIGVVTGKGPVGGGRMAVHALEVLWHHV